MGTGSAAEPQGKNCTPGTATFSSAHTGPQNLYRTHGTAFLAGQSSPQITKMK